MCWPHFASVISDPSTTLHAYQSPYLTEDSLSACPEPSSERHRLRDPDGMSIGRRQGRGCNQHQAACPCVCASGLGIWGGWASSWGLTCSWVPFPFVTPGLFFFFFLQIFLSALTQPVQGQGEALTVPRVSGQGPALSKVHSANSH